MVLSIPVAILIAAFSASISAQQERTGNPLSTAEIADLVTPSVITIRGTSGLGSGVIVDASGVLVTNLHVIQGETELSVELANGDIYDDVSVIDVDERRDLVLLKINAFNLSPAEFGDSDDVEEGRRRYAVDEQRAVFHLVLRPTRH